MKKSARTDLMSEIPAPSLERLVCLLGDPVGHTLSPAMHNAAFQALGAPYRYLAFRVAPEDFYSAMEGLVSLGAVGANITVPYKERAFRWVPHLAPSASRTGAVNTVLFGEDGPVGYNTDVAGVRTTLSALAPVRGSTLVLGAGGAARAAVCALLEEGFQRFAISNRTDERAKNLASELLSCDAAEDDTARAPTCEIVPWGEAPSFAPDLVVNTTSLGLHNSPWPEDLLRVIVSTAKNGALLDLVYVRGGETPLCERARNNGIPALSGQEVLLHQGTAAFEIFSGMAAPVEIMREALERGAAV